jgi:hypothetical protein
MRRFNDNYRGMIGSLQQAFNCPSPEQQGQATAAYGEAVGAMRRMPNLASAIIREAEDNGIKGGIPFEYGGA